MKICSKCGVSKNVVEFSKDKRARDGRRSECKACSKSYQRAYYAENRDKRLENTKAYYTNNRDELLEYKKAYRTNNRDKISKISRAYHTENREKRLEQKKGWQKLNQDKVIMARERRRARLSRASLKSAYLKEVDEFFAKANRLGLVADHIIPIGNQSISPRGMKVGVCGLHVPWNLQMLTKKQNSEKNVWYDSEAYRQWLELSGGDPLVLPLLRYEDDNE